MTTFRSSFAAAHHAPRWVLAALMFVASAAAAQQAPRDSARKVDALSLVPNRTIAFETSEGTYMNVDLSPDGASIVFDLLGDIYTVPLGGGRATRVTSGMAYDIHPVFSPDGGRIAFISDASGSDNIWTVAADGTDRRQLTRERERAVLGVEWAPDGEYLIARRAGDLWLYHKDGGNGMEISRDALANGAFGPVFSPDGRFLYFSVRAGNPVGHAPALANITGWQVRRLDRRTGDIAQVTAAPFGAFRPRISPDGKWMAYGMRMDAQTGLRIRNLQSDEDRWIAPKIDRDNAERGGGSADLLPRYEFTPDGSAIVIATGGTFHRIDITTGRDERIAFTAQVEQQLGPFVYNQQRLSNDAVRVRNLRYSNRSPDGKRLVFSALAKLWTMDLPNGQPRALRSRAAGQFQPVFSPDGRWIAYVTWSDSAFGHVWKVPAAGGQPQRLTQHAGFYMHPAWSPDGSRIAFIREDAAAFRNVWSRNTGQIHWIDAAGGEAQLVTSAPSDNRLTFSADGARITYVAEVGGAPGPPPADGPPFVTSRVMSVRLDGTDKRPLANISGETYEVVPSPDNRLIAFSIREDIFLAALPLTADPPTIGETSGPGPVKRVTREGGVDIHWERDGRTLAWNFGSEFFRVDAQQVIAAPADTARAGAQQDTARAGAQQDPTRPAALAVQPQSVAVHISIPRHVPRGTVVLRGGDVITMRGEEVQRNAAVVVTDNRITWVGPVAQLQSPAGARTIDVTGKTLMPGMIDMHAHLRPPRDVFVEHAWPYLANLAFGVTTTRDVSSSNDGFAYHELVEAGEILGPRIYSTGRAMTTGNAKIENLEDARHMVRHYKKQGTNVIKQYMQPHRRQRQWVIQAAKEEGMNVTNEGGGDLRLDLTMVLDGYTGFEHALPSRISTVT